MDLVAARRLVASGSFREARDLLAELDRRQPGDAAVLDLLGECWLHLDRIAAARDCFRRCLALAPGSAPVLIGLGQCDLYDGDFDGAEHHARAALAADRRATGAYALLRGAERLAPSDRPALEALLADPAVAPAHRIAALAALAVLDERAGDEAGAFARHAAAAALRSRERRYDAGREERITGRFLAAARACRFDPAEGHPSAKPVFIVGLFRSGSSLVEQILASHGDVHAGGERDAVSRLSATIRVGDEAYPEALPALDGAALRCLGADYLASFPVEALDCARLTDKMPGNTVHLALIRRMFPKAALIHTRRHPLDVCLSMFTQSFAQQADYMVSLEAIADHVARQSALMAALADLLPSPPLEVLYEAVVADLEAEARRIVAHIGLAWDAACLAFHTRPGPVRTASGWQVRQPIHAGAVGRWRRHGDRLEPARRRLAAEIEAYEARLAALGLAGG